jgi:hypothetical protein
MKICPNCELPNVIATRHSNREVMHKLEEKFNTSHTIS